MSDEEYVCATEPWLSAGNLSGVPMYDRSFMNSVAKRVTSQARACASTSMCASVIASKNGSPPLYCSSFEIAPGWVGAQPATLPVEGMPLNCFSSSDRDVQVLL